MDMHYGKDCPSDKVQIECVIVRAEQKAHFDVLPGWLPGDSAHIELYVGGRRFLILAGDAARQYGHNGPGVFILSDVGLKAEQTSINGAFITFDETGERIWQATK